MKPVIGEYRTNSGNNIFRFHFEIQNNGEIRIFILDQPSYKGRCSSLHSTHRNISNGKAFIDPPTIPKTLTKAILLAKHWAENTEKYIEYGRSF